MATELGENVKTWRGWYFSPIRHRWYKLSLPISRAWVNELEPPYRHGRGVALRVLPSLTLTFGRWWPTSEERPHYRPGEVPRQPKKNKGWHYYAEPVVTDVDDFEDPDDTPTVGIYVR